MVTSVLYAKINLSLLSSSNTIMTLKPSSRLRKNQLFLLACMVGNEHTFENLIDTMVDINALVPLEETLGIEPRMPGAPSQMITALDGFLMASDYYPTQKITKESAKKSLKMVAALIEKGARGTCYGGFGELTRTLIKEGRSPVTALMLKHFSDAPVQVKDFLDSPFSKRITEDFQAELERCVLQSTLEPPIKKTHQVLSRL